MSQEDHESAPGRERPCLSINAPSSASACCGGGQTSCASGSGASSAAPPPPAAGRSFRVNGLDCAEEVAILNKVVGPHVGGSDKLTFDALNARMTLLPGAASVSDERILKLVASTGMSAKPWSPQSAETDQAAHLARQKFFTAFSAGFWLAGLIFHMVETGAAGALNLFSGHGHAPTPLVEIGLFMTAVGFGVWQVAPKAWSAARRLSPDMNLLMMVAVAGAIALGEYFEAATVAFFFALSLTLESWSVGRARNAVAALLDLSPPTARVIGADGAEQDLPAEKVAIGDLFIVRGGERIALDGEVVAGAGEVNQAPITGESAPVAKQTGDTVYAGTINGEGALTIRAIKAAGDSVLSKIIQMVGDAHARRAPVEQWVTKFARIYTPLIMALALAIAVTPPLLLGGNWADWFYNALVLLVIACPCALVISTPISIVAALASSARAGVLIKGGAYVEAPSKLQALAIDKTGTLTLGAPEVASLHPLNGADPRRLLALAAALEARSAHPLAKAILERAARENVTFRPAEDARAIAGKGVEGRNAGDEGGAIWLGSPRFAAEKCGAGANAPLKDAAAQSLINQIEIAGNTLVVVGLETQIMGLIELRDQIRPEAARAVKALRAQGVRKIVMLTGDNARTAKAVADAVGVDDVRAELLPEDKLAAIDELTQNHGVVAMVGDGVNDAPAMARAHFAIAMGAMGSDAAIETADIALMSDDIDKLPWLVGHSRRAMDVIRQNIVFALATKALFVGLTAFGLASMWGAIAADVGVSLLVVANAMRLLRG